MRYAKLKANCQCVAECATSAYVDDLIFFCESEAHCWEVDKFCRSTLKERGLDLPEISKKNKTCIYGPEQTAEFLGMGVKFFSEDNTYKLIITDTQIKAISDRFQALKDIKSNLNNRIYFSDLGRMLESIA